MRSETPGRLSPRSAAALPGPLATQLRIGPLRVTGALSRGTGSGGISLEASDTYSGAQRQAGLRASPLGKSRNYAMQTRCQTYLSETWGSYWIKIQTLCIFNL